ncbi:MAG: HAMP domain-containing sensor histidine kinase [Pseudomonadota bacterium]
MPGRPSEEKLEHGVPLFLSQLADALALPPSPSLSLARGDASSTKAITDSAALHGHDLLRLGFTLAQVVHGYGDVCQVVTELAQEIGAKITVDDFHVFNRCLDDAIAGAVSAYGEQRERDITHQGSERQGVLAHELRNLLHVARLSFDALKHGKVGLNGSTAAVHERSLANLTALVERSLIEVRLEAGKPRIERLSVFEFISEVGASAAIQAEARRIRLTVEPVAGNLVIDADRELLSSALMNLLQNAFKFTGANGSVSLATRATTNRVVLDVCDECGGLPAGRAEALFLPFTQASADRSGLGLGLSIALSAVRINGGDLSVRNIPGKGCVFTIALPRAHDAETVPGSEA